MMAAKTTPAPGNRSLANANPAMVEHTRMIAIESRHTIVEFFICWPHGRAEPSARQLSSECPPAPMNDDWLLNELSIMNQNG